MAMTGKLRSRQSFGGKLLAGLGHVTNFAGAAHTAYQIGKGLYQLGVAAAPLATARL